MSHRIGADIGGTFTDLVLVDDAGGAFRIGKVLTTPAQPDQAVEQGIVEVAGRGGRTRCRRSPTWSTAPPWSPTP